MGMTRPLFVIGMQRNGTSILARIVQSADGVSRQFHPCPRWDIPAVAEIGGAVPPGKGLWTAALRRHMTRIPGTWALAKLALPMMAESFAWPRLARLFPKAAFILIRRQPADAHLSWRTLPYLLDDEAQAKIKPVAYLEWATRQLELLELFAARNKGRSVLVAYEDMVIAPRPTLAPVWKLIGGEPKTGWESCIRKPKHWNVAL